MGIATLKRRRYDGGKRRESAASNCHSRAGGISTAAGRHNTDGAKRHLIRRGFYNHLARARWENAAVCRAAIATHQS